jgi:hypothetical protein
MIISTWFAWLFLPISGPIKEWTEIRQRQAKGEQIDWLSAGTRFLGRFLFGLGGFFTAILGGFLMVLLAAILFQGLTRTPH